MNLATPRRDDSSTPPRRALANTGLVPFFALACGITWLAAMPAAIAWMRHENPAPLAVASSGLSAFGPLLAAFIVAARSKELRDVFGRWRTNVAWIALALFVPMLVHLAATAVYLAIGGHPIGWFHLPANGVAVAALIVFPLGEEFGWRGFAHPRLVHRFGPIRGSLLVGLAWAIWHFAYAITPAKAGFDAVQLVMLLTELPLYSIILAWLFERANRSMAVAIAFHTGAHLDHLEIDPNYGCKLHAAHLLVVAVFAFFASRVLRRALTHPRNERPIDA